MTSVVARTVGAILFGAIGLAQPAPARSLSPSPGWARAMPPGPDANVKITEAYARMVAREAYFWAWPIVDMHNRRMFFQSV